MASKVEDEVSDESDSRLRVSSAIKYKNTFLYDTGASHHFARNVKDFVKILKLSKPFRFDQAIGNSALTQQGTIRAKIDSLTLELPETLYSLNSTCNIVSVVWLKRSIKL